MPLVNNIHEKYLCLFRILLYFTYDSILLTLSGYSLLACKVDGEQGNGTAPGTCRNLHESCQADGTYTGYIYFTFNIKNGDYFSVY